MMTTDDRIAILNANLVEMRRTYDHVSNIYDQLRVKALAFIAGEIALVTFLFATNIQFPEVLYGQIFFVSGVLFLLCAFGFLMWTIAAVQWKIPCDFQGSKATLEKFLSEEAITEYVHDDYVQAINHCMSIVSKKAKRFNVTIYLLTAGAIIVLLIKYGGPSL